MKKTIGIYKITSPSGKVYIGQSWHIIHRWADYGKKTTKSQRHLHFSFNKYGKKAHDFQILHELPPDVEQEVLDRYEQLYMDLYRDAGFVLMNCKEAGAKGKLSEETKRRVSESLKGRAVWNKGLTGVVKMSEATRDKMRIASKAHGSPWNYGRKMSDKTRSAIAKANIGRKKSVEEREKLSISLMGRPYHGKNNGKVRSKEVRDLHSKIQKARSDNKGQSHNMAKLTNQQVLEIRSKYIPRIYTSRLLAKEYNISKTNVLDIVNNKIWVHLC